MTTPRDRMSGVVLTGHGGLDRLEWRDDLEKPEPAPGQVLIGVRASAVNNTDVNTRVGWYSKAVRGDTKDAVASAGEDAAASGSWTGEPLAFPRIQGADCCGEIVGVGEGVDRGRVGERVLVHTRMDTGATGSVEHRGSTWPARNTGTTPIEANTHATIQQVSGIELEIQA